MNLKYNINKIDVELSNIFESVTISEGSDINIGNYVELSIMEGNKEAKVIIKKSDLDNNKFNWKYYSNPLNENSDLVERTSVVDGFVNDIKDIFEKNRFDSDYIENINK
jgi:hypothetical protein